MNDRVKKALILLLGLSLSLAAGARNPKIGPGLSPGLGDGDDGNETGGAANTEVSLPVGLPATGPDPSMGTVDPASSPSNIVYTFDLNDDNGVSSVNQTHSAFEKARDMNAACVLIRINSFAGGWDVAENIRQEIIGYDRPVMVYVNNQAIPAATFISTGADSIYTKKGKTISNKKGAAKPAPKKSSVDSDRASDHVIASGTHTVTSSDPDDMYSADATMNEILFKAGLSNLTVVEHNPGIAEKAINFLMSPFALLTILLCVGFIMRKTAMSRLPGPMMYALAVIVLIYLAPYQLSGLASNTEIGAALLLIIGSIAAARYNKRWIAGTLLVLLTITLSLVRAGDTGVLLHYGSFSELLSIPGMPLGLVILGWWIAKWREKQLVRNQQNDNAAVAGLANAA
jgi:membrane-bound ClpP family serine protease